MHIVFQSPRNVELVGYQPLFQYYREGLENSSKSLCQPIQTYLQASRPNEEGVLQRRARWETILGVVLEQIWHQLHHVFVCLGRTSAVDYVLQRNQLANRAHRLTRRRALWPVQLPHVLSEILVAVIVWRLWEVQWLHKSQRKPVNPFAQRIWRLCISRCGRPLDIKNSGGMPWTATISKKHGLFGGTNRENPEQDKRTFWPRPWSLTPQSVCMQRGSVFRKECEQSRGIVVQGTDTQAWRCLLRQRGNHALRLFLMSSDWNEIVSDSHVTGLYTLEQLKSWVFVCDVPVRSGKISHPKSACRDCKRRIPTASEKWLAFVMTQWRHMGQQPPALNGTVS